LKKSRRAIERAFADPVTLRAWQTSRELTIG
jgi:hypothetical protein